MALVVGDPGFRQNPALGQVTGQIQQYGQQALQNREKQGQATLEWGKGEAERQGVTMKYLMDNDQQFAQAMEGATMGLAQGNQGLAKQMFGAFGSLEADPTQLMNEKWYDHVKTNLADKDLFDKQITETVNQKVTKLIQTGSSSVTPETIAQIEEKEWENGFWTPIFENAGIQPESLDENGDPVWGARDIQDSMVKYYLGDDKADWASIRGTPQEENFRQAVIQGSPPSRVISEMGKDSAVLQSMTDAEREAFLKRTGGVVQADGTLLGATQSDQTLAGAGPGLRANAFVDRGGRPADQAIFQGAGQTFVNPNEPVTGQTGAASQPVSFGERATFEEREVMEPSQVLKTIPGYASSLKTDAQRLRDQGKTEAQRSVVGDLGIRGAEADIQYKNALIAQAFQSMQGTPGMDKVTEKILIDAVDTNNNMVQDQNIEELGTLNKADAEKHNAALKDYQKKMQAMGLQVPLTTIPINRTLRKDYPILMLGNVQLPGQGAGFGDEDANSLLGRS